MQIYLINRIIMYLTALFFGLITLIILIFDMVKPKNYPLGPRWMPIFGNALKIWKLRQKYGMLCKVVMKLDKEYGKKGVVGLKIGKDKIVVATSCKAIKEMMTNEHLDGRPTGIFYETRTWGTRKGILLTDEQLWQEQRRFVLKHLKDFGFARRGMADIIRTETEHLIDEINKTIDAQGGEVAEISMNDLFGVYILNTLWTLMAGIRYSRDNAELKDLQQIFNELFKNIDMIGCSFSHFPFLRYIAPNYSGYSQFIDIHQYIYEFLGREVKKHKRDFHFQNEPRDLMDIYIQVLNSPNHTESFSEKQLLAICLDMFLAGSETTNKTLGFAFLHILRNKSIQENIQSELDVVVGRERLATLDDRPNLPYCEAVVHEALRFFMGNTFSLPHRALRNTTLCNFDIPKDTMVVACFTGMLMNENSFPNPRKFLPERYIKNNKLVMPSDFLPFGLGRHKCMGEIMGRQNLLLFITSLMQNFRFEIPENTFPDDQPDDGATPCVKPFKAYVYRR